MVMDRSDRVLLEYKVILCEILCLHKGLHPIYGIFDFVKKFKKIRDQLKEKEKFTFKKNCYHMIGGVLCNVANFTTGPNPS